MKTFSLERDTSVQENPDRGQITLFHQNFTDSDHLPRNMFLGQIPARFLGRMYGFLWGENKSDIKSDIGKGIIFTTSRKNFFPRAGTIRLSFPVDFLQCTRIKKLFKLFFLEENPKQESIFIGGFVPMTQCDYTLELEKPGEKGFVILQTPGGKIIIDKKNSDDYSVESYFLDASEKIRCKQMIVPAKEGKISLTIHFDGTSRTNTISGNDQDPLVTPFYSQSRSQLHYPSFSGGYIKISTIALPGQSTSAIHLHSLSQSAPRKLITPVGDKKSLPFGLDGPHAFSTIQNGLLSMKQRGFRGTIWFDVGYLRDDHYREYLTSFLQNECWEAGIHYSKSLIKLSSAELHTFIDDEYDAISSQIQTSPKSWCSFRNGDTVGHANYLFEKFSMLWRNGDAGVRSERKIGGLEDANWDWWNSASKAGIMYPVFTHQTDRDPALRYSISFSKFKTWIDNYHANGISIIPFGEWWNMNANTNDMRITDISIKNHSLRFRIQTNGERGLVNVHISAGEDLVVVDHQSREMIPWSDHGDNSITFYVQSDHEYELFRKDPGKFSAF
jgi:hypothetical protein